MNYNKVVLLNQKKSANWRKRGKKENFVSPNWPSGIFLGSQLGETKLTRVKPREWEARGLENAAGAIISWRFPFPLKELENIPKKDPNDPNMYMLLRMAEAIEMGLTEEELMAQRDGLPDSGTHVIEFGIKDMNRDHRFCYGAVTGGQDLLEGLIEQGFRPMAIYFEQGISHGHRQAGKEYTDYRVSLLLVKSNKKKAIELPDALLNRLFSRRWCFHLWDNTMTKDKNLTFNFVHPLPYWDGPEFTIVPALH